MYVLKSRAINLHVILPFLDLFFFSHLSPLSVVSQCDTKAVRSNVVACKVSLWGLRHCAEHDFTKAWLLVMSILFFVPSPLLAWTQRKGAYGEPGLECLAFPLLGMDDSLEGGDSMIRDEMRFQMRQSWVSEWVSGWMYNVDEWHGG